MTPICPRCEGRHRTLTGAGRCLRKAAIWIRGTGPWALISTCNHLTVTLHTSRRAAERTRTGIDRTGCGHACYRLHTIQDTTGMQLERGTR